METIEDIVREMRGYVNAEAFIQHEDGDVDFVDICGELADRIEAAAKELMVEKIEWCSECARMSNPKRVREILNENARLRAMIKNMMTSDFTVGELVKALKDARRLSNESEAK